MGPIHYPKYFKLHSLGRDVNAEVEERKRKCGISCRATYILFACSWQFKCGLICFCFLKVKESSLVGNFAIWMRALVISHGLSVVLCAR